MAKVRIKNIKGFTTSFVKSFNKRMSKNISREPKAEIEEEIIITILSGRSPVKGKQFKQYSKKYADREKGGARKPVDMNQTGKMLDSLVVKQIRGKPGIFIKFRDNLAVIHNKLGAGKSKVIRRLLPNFSKDEVFKDNIQKMIIKMMKRATKK